MTDTIQPPTDALMWLRRGLRAVHAGDRTQAWRCFQAAHDADSSNVVVLLWLAWLSPSREESLTLLSRALELDPHNEQAHAGIRWARRHAFPSDTQSLSPQHIPSAALEAGPGQPTETDGQDGVRDTAERADGQGSSHNGMHVERAGRRFTPLVLLVAIGLTAIGVVLGVRHAPTAVLASLLASPTATATSASAEAAMPTFSPRSTPIIIPTYTLGPSATVPPTPTPSVTPVLVSTDVPNPVPGPSETPALRLATATAGGSTPTADVPVPLATAPSPEGSGEKWIDVDLTNQHLKAYEGNVLVFEAVVSTGLGTTPTVPGKFNIYWKLVASDMAGPGYYLVGVPYTMYYYRGYALHGTYWHTNFGQPMSHGCINLRTEDAKWLSDWADPSLPAGGSEVRSSDANPGTLVVIHH